MGNLLTQPIQQNLTLLGGRAKTCFLLPGHNWECALRLWVAHWHQCLYLPHTYDIAGGHGLGIMSSLVKYKCLVGHIFAQGLKVPHPCSRVFSRSPSRIKEFIELKGSLEFIHPLLYTGILQNCLISVGCHAKSCPSPVQSVGSSPLSSGAKIPTELPPGSINPPVAFSIGGPSSSHSHVWQMGTETSSSSLLHLSCKIPSLRKPSQLGNCLLSGACSRLSL